MGGCGVGRGVTVEGMKKIRLGEEEERKKETSAEVSATHPPGDLLLSLIPSFCVCVCVSVMPGLFCTTP